MRTRCGKFFVLNGYLFHNACYTSVCFCAKIINFYVRFDHLSFSQGFSKSGGDAVGDRVKGGKARKKGGGGGVKGGGSWVLPGCN